MKLSELMSLEPLTAEPGMAQQTLERMMVAGRIHHLPLVDGDALVGMWVASDDGPIVLVGPERVQAVAPDTDAVEALRALIRGGGEALVAMQDGHPVGILTRTDALRLVREGLDAAGRRGRAPLVIRFIGPAGAGKTTLLARTLPLLRSCQVGIVDANPDRAADTSAGASAPAVVHAPQAHWRKGLRDVIGRLGEVDVILVEDLDQPARLGTGLGEDVQVLVVPVAQAGDLDAVTLREAQAVVLTHADDAPLVEVERLRQELARRAPHTSVVPVGRGGEVDAWQDWLRERLRRHRG